MLFTYCKPLGILKAANAFQLPATTCKENSLQFVLYKDVFILTESANDDINKFVKNKRSLRIIEVLIHEIMEVSLSRGDFVVVFIIEISPGVKI